MIVLKGLVNIFRSTGIFIVAALTVLVLGPLAVALVAVIVAMLAAFIIFILLAGYVETLSTAFAKRRPTAEEIFKRLIDNRVASLPSHLGRVNDAFKPGTKND